jgi:hypothetical protein
MPRIAPPPSAQGARYDLLTREDFEMAAKAVGMRGDPGLDGTDAVAIIEGVLRRWNPLTDDGDALRLAVALGLRVSTGQADWYDPIGEGFMVETDDDLCPYAATRHAIFRAAIAVGRAMP